MPSRLAQHFPTGILRLIHPYFGWLLLTIQGLESWSSWLPNSFGFGRQRTLHHRNISGCRWATGQKFSAQFKCVRRLPMQWDPHTHTHFAGILQFAAFISTCPKSHALLNVNFMVFSVFGFLWHVHSNKQTELYWLHKPEFFGHPRPKQCSTASCPQMSTVHILISWCMLHHVAEQFCSHGVSWAMGIVGVLLSRIPQPQPQQLPRLKSFWTASVFTWWMGRWLSSCGGDRVARSCPILKQSHLNCFNFLRS